VLIRVKDLAGGVEGLDVVFCEGLKKHAVGHLDASVEVLEVSSVALFASRNLVGGLGGKDGMRDGLDGNGEHVDGLKKVLGEAGNSKVLLLLLLLRSVALEVEEVCLKVLEPALWTCQVEERDFNAEKRNGP